MSFATPTPTPTIPIPFQRLLKVVAIIDREDTQTRELIDHIVAENYQVEVKDNFRRDVSEDADVGAYILLVDGERLEGPRRRAGDVLAGCRLVDRPVAGAVELLAGRGDRAAHVGADRREGHDRALRRLGDDQWLAIGRLR